MKIKIRAWDKIKKKMWLAEEMGEDELSYNPNGRGFCNPNPHNTRLTVYMSWMIPLLCSNLRDANGKEIYEGDILNINGGAAGIFAGVEFEYGCFVINAPWIKGGESKPELKYYINTLICVAEIVGNVFENPELIKGER
jgi:uncharacterized phage protein (TIGR01671 family)